jgi:cellulose synthase/poly-beta-1,6-N-acetylglucosamine synthase-like glycosyltransferase
VPIPDRPSYSPRDVTVIIPTVEPENKDFKECLVSVWENGPRDIFIVAVGEQMKTQIQSIVDQLPLECTERTKVAVLSTDEANKRSQIGHALQYVQTEIVALSDDHVFWCSSKFIRTVLAPFEDSKVGGVCTNKRVRRDYQLSWGASIWNMLGALYLERHNSELRATNVVDGGVFVISGRTAVYRTEILKNGEFLRDFTNEYLLGSSEPVRVDNDNFITRFWYRLLAWLGPVSIGDDNYITRYLVRNEWDIKVQYCDDALIETTLGTYPKFIWQCVRWSRTTWNSNTASLLTDRTVWRRQPWCVYAVYLTSFVNFALLYDPALVYTFSKTTWRHQIGFTPLCTWILLTKLVKLTPYFLRYPRDLMFLPAYYAFAYFHSFIKLYAFLTFWNTTWEGRNLTSRANQKKRG